MYIHAQGKVNLGWFYSWRIYWMY